MNDLPKNKSLLVFLEVARCGGIMNASKKLNMTQPSVTRIIKELEIYMGMPLFDRTNSGVFLNRAGNIFHSRVLSYINGMQKSISEIRKEFGKDNQKFSLGYSSLVGYTIFPEVINEFKKNNQNVAVHIYEGQLSSLLPLLSTGDIDCAIGTLLNDELPYEYSAEKLFQSRFSVFSSALNPFARVKSIAELKSAKWVLPETSLGYYYNLNTFLKDHGIDVDSAIRTDSISSILNLVTCANYVTVLASPMGEGRNKKLSLHEIAIEEKMPVADYYFVWEKKSISSDLLDKFMAIIKDRCSVSAWGK
ncbi:putative transcriptional regulator [Shimwellia blattae DSM 4481 = NBRC 105725]|uniref:Putative transcriptional regulator n=3 Tax=Shimwellia blattae TaxID=563 RepID=I2BDQ9_SHIBC|nr:transcriptional regulator TdcA [Shimwellia blattae]AFJ48663.1 putative transcriptional regulator [Shimwellia blattae DSM 4481 = NBRC 105725]